MIRSAFTCEHIHAFPNNRLRHTILIEASVRLMNLGRTSPSSPAASSSAASQRDKTVPTSWAKHSVHVRSALGRPSAEIS